MKKLLIAIKHHIPIDFSVVVFFDFLAKVLSAIVAILLIRILDTAEYAQFTKFNSIASFINGVFGTGIALSLVRYLTECISRGKENGLGLYSRCIIYLLCLGTISIFIGPILTSVYSIEINIAIYACCFGFVLALIHINQSYFQSHEQYILSGLSNNIRYFLTCVVLLVLAFFVSEINLNNIVLAFLVSGIVSFAIGLLKIYYKQPVKTLFAESEAFGSMIKSSVWLVLYSVFLNLLSQIDIIMLTQLTDDVKVAMYGVAFKYYGLALAMLPAIKTVIGVRSSKVEYVDSVESRKKFVRNWLKRIWKYAVVFCAIAILLAGVVLPLLNGHEYDDSINTFRVLMIGVAISYTFAPNSQMMMSAKKHRELCIISLIALSFNCVANYFLIPLCGTIGAAIATILSHAIINITSTFILLRQQDNPAGDSSCN